MSNQIWTAYSETTRKFEQVDLDEAELVPGQKLLIKFWVPSDQKFVTVPGASLYTVTGNGDLVLEA